MTAEIALTKQARLGQLAGELSARIGQDVSVWARHDDDGNATAVAAEVDEQTLREAVDNHTPAWPPPWRGPIDELEAALRGTQSAVDLVRVLLAQLIPVLRDLERRR